MTDRKRIPLLPFLDGSAPPARKVITIDFVVNQVKTNNVSSEKKRK